MGTVKESYLKYIGQELSTNLQTIDSAELVSGIEYN